MPIPHDKMKQAIAMHCHLSAVSNGFRIFWPDRQVELLCTSIDEALTEMQAAQTILKENPKYEMEVDGCIATIFNGALMLKVPDYPSCLLAELEAGEDEWEPSHRESNPQERMLRIISDMSHINGIPTSGGVAYQEGVPASDCPYLEGSDDFERWNDEWDREADKVINNKPKVGSVITNRYRAQYSEMGHPTHCGDALAIILNNICTNKAGTNLQLFEAICAANGVSLAKYNRKSRGWQGRLRMTGRNLLAKRVLENGGRLVMPEWLGPDHELGEEWVAQAERKFKPRTEQT